MFGLELLDKYLVQIACALVGTLLMLSDGMQYSWASPAVPRLLANDSVIPMTQSEGEWVVQSYILGSVSGGLISYTIFRFITRKQAIVVACVPVSLAWLGGLLATTPEILFATRFIGGIGKNMAFVSVPLYLGEIADPNIRGVLGTFIYMFYTLGMVLSYSITPFVPLRVSCMVGLALALLQGALMYFLPESPYYQLSKGKVKEARGTLQLLRRRQDVDEELEQIKAAVERQTAEAGSFVKLFTVPTNLKALCILVFLRVVQILSGISVMSMNVHTIFSMVGGDISPNVSAIIYAVTMLVCALFTLGTMERFGRKTLMIFSCSLTALTMYLASIFFYLKYQTTIDTSSFAWLPILCMLVYVYGYRVGLGTVPIVMVSELLSVSVKVQGVAVCDFLYTTASFISNFVFYQTKNKFGMYAPFCIFGSVCLVSVVCSKLFVPETRGKTLEEIQQNLIKGLRVKDVKVEKDKNNVC